MRLLDSKSSDGEPGSSRAELALTIVTTSHRTLPYAARCIESVFWQQGSGFRMKFIYVDDASGYDADEAARLRRLVEGRGGTFVASEPRLYQLGAIRRALAGETDPQSVVCLLDGDDYLLPDALQAVAGAYANPDVAMTYGNTLFDYFERLVHPERPGFPQETILNTPVPADVWAARSFRDDGFRCFHLRTFRKWLWDLVAVDALRGPDGAPLRSAGDAAFLFPMLEMLAHPRHVRLIEEPVYVYRMHRRNVHFVDPGEQARNLDHVRFGHERYAPLDRGVLRDLLAARPAGASAAGGRADVRRSA